MHISPSQYCSISCMLGNTVSPLAVYLICAVQNKMSETSFKSGFASYWWSQPLQAIIRTALTLPMFQDGVSSWPLPKERTISTWQRKREEKLEQFPNTSNRWSSSGFVVCALGFVCGKPEGVLQSARANQHHSQEQSCSVPTIWKTGGGKWGAKCEVNKNTLSNQPFKVKQTEPWPGSSSRALWFFTPLNDLIAYRASSFSFMSHTFTLFIRKFSCGAWALTLPEQSMLKPYGYGSNCRTRLQTDRPEFSASSLVLCPALCVNNWQWKLDAIKNQQW